MKTISFELTDEVLEQIAALAAAKLQEKALYTVPDLMERYGVSKATIRRRLSSGAFGPLVEMGDKKLATREGVLEYDRAHTKSPAGLLGPSAWGKR